MVSRYTSNDAREDPEMYRMEEVFLGSRRIESTER
jgi:hypothetical protein